MKARRRSSSSLKREFVKKWIKGLQICRNRKKDWTILERKNAIKLSADVAMAATRKAGTQWRRALLCDVVSQNPTNKAVVEKLLGRKLQNSRVRSCSRRIVRQSRICSGKAGTRVVPKSSSIARRLVKNRSRTLRKLVPGGEEMDGVSLLQETLDYIVSLRLQVDVMRRLAAMASN
ncbi:transcription factor IBH1-like 1 [Salvia miltiorrhiza]|uniref:transcription factor IBH1-like 1 n=1 Tax=Salvia miltiorrhiza TaxID=226208 RepID=UPI0025ABCDC9|nr:transcription factor IBH1-like 1 [Salvia miltiorrhiza]